MDEVKITSAQLSEDGAHALLEASTPAYSSATVRRAFIVWMTCGQRNSFKDVCNYYHRLETLEEQLPAARRAASRHHEFNMFSNPPPTSPFLNQVFPKLYTQSDTIQHYIKKVESMRYTFDHKRKQTDEIKRKIETYDRDMQNGLTSDILETSRMIETYCKTYMIPLKKFLTEFKEYAKRCGLKYTVKDVTFYIKRKMVEEELQMVANYTKTLSFLNLNSKEPKKHERNRENRIKPSLNLQKLVATKIEKKDFMNQYWDDLTNFGTINIRNDVTRT